MVRSIQTGSINIPVSSNTGSVGIAAVNTARAHAELTGLVGNNVSNQPGQAFARVELTNSTTVSAYRAENAFNSSLTVAFTVVEYL